VSKVLGLAVLAAIGLVAKSQLPELQRYMKIRNM
jgi:hypothetical protein